MANWYDELIGSTKRDDKESKHRRVLVYGESGTGKTLFGATAPKPMFINIDHGLLSLSERNIIVPTINIPPMMKGIYRNMMSIIADATNRTGAFAPGAEFGDRQTLVIDSITGLANSQFLWDIMFHEGKRKPTEEKAQFDDYSAIRFRLQTLTEALKAVPMNVIVLAESMIEDDEDTGRKLGTVNMLGSYRRAIVGAFDYAFLFATESEVRDGKKINVWTAHTRPFLYWKAKTRSDDSMPERIVDPTWAKLFPKDAQ
jgi:hypothetical protein